MILRITSTLGTPLSGQLSYQNDSQADVNLVEVVDRNFNFPRSTGLIIENVDGKESVEGIVIEYPNIPPHYYHCVGFGYFIANYQETIRRRS